MKTHLVFYLLFITCFNYAQKNKEWKEDVDLLEKHLSQNEYLFKKTSKQAFQHNINLLKDNSDIETQFWQLSDVLQSLQITGLKLKDIPLKRFPFVIQTFNSKYYLTQIHPDYSHLLGYQLVLLNNMPITKIVNKPRDVTYLNSKSFLKTYKKIDTDTLTLGLKKTEKLVFIKIPLSDLKLTKLTPKQKPFYKQKQNRWFWMYGINFGQQVYFKYNLGLSKEFIQKTVDSLSISKRLFAKQYGLPLQTIYDAPSFNPFITKLVSKFKKRRYKKLFIDLRDNTIGNSKTLIHFISEIQKLKRINKKNNLIVFIDKSLSFSAIETVLLLQKHLNITLIGEDVKGISCSSDKIKTLKLPHSKFIVFYPNQAFKPIFLIPDIPVKTTFSHYQKGIDPILQRALDL